MPEITAQEAESRTLGEHTPPLERGEFLSPLPKDASRIRQLTCDYGARPYFSLCRARACFCQPSLRTRSRNLRSSLIALICGTIAVEDLGTAVLVASVSTLVLVAAGAHENNRAVSC